MNVAELSDGQALWALGSMARLSQIPFDARLVAQGFPPPYRFADLCAPLENLGLHCKVRARLPALHRLRLPCLLEVAASNVGSDIAADGASDIAPDAVIGIAVRADDDGLWVFFPGQDNPVKLMRAELARRLTGRLIECRARARALTDPDACAAGARPFGFGWFVPLLLRHRAVWRDVLLASLAIQLIALVTPLLTQVIIDKVVVHNTRDTLLAVGAALLLFMAFNAAFTWIRQYLVLHTGNRVDGVLGVRVFEHLLRLPLRYFEHRSTGVIAARLHAVETIREFVASSIVTLVLDLPFLLIFVGVMLYYNVALTLLVLALLATITVLSVAVAPALRRRMNHQFLLGARNQAFVTEYVASLETVKSLQMEPQLTRRWRDDLAAYLEAGFQTRQIANTYNVVANALEQLMTLLVLTLGAWSVMRASAGGQEPFTIGMLVAFQMFAGKLSQPLLRLVGLWQQFQQASIAVRRLADVMDAPAEPYAVTPSRAAQGAGRIEVVDLAFRYGPERPFLYQHLTLTLEPGTTAVLLGPSGSGKSTLAKLLQGFYEPSGGCIRIDGTDIRHLAANELRAHFGVVPQETSLFSGTILDNLRIANPQASFDDVVRACKMAEIHTVLEALPQGYQTEIGERGAGLSGGQKQRVAIARALLKRPKILIFDEATSALDAATAEQFAHTVNTLHGKVAMLFITHQAPRALLVDEVIRIGDSRATVVASVGTRAQNDIAA